MATNVILDSNVRWELLGEKKLSLHLGLDGEEGVSGNTVLLNLGSKKEENFGPVVNGLRGAVVTPSAPTTVANINAVPSNAVFASGGFFGITAERTVDTLAGSKWQIATTPSFAEIINAVEVNTAILTELSLTTLGTPLDSATKYYIRVLYFSATGVHSKFSPATEFTTA